MSLAQELRELAAKRTIEMPKERAAEIINKVRSYAEWEAKYGRTYFQWDVNSNAKLYHYIPRENENDIARIVEDALKNDGFHVIIELGRALAISWK